MADEKQDIQNQAVQGAVCREADKPRGVYLPRVDVYETKDAIVLLADMPGVDDKSVDITLEKDVLTIRGSVAANGLKDHGIYYAEYGVGDYERAFSISDEVDREHISAKVKDGLLNVLLPKIENAKVKKIAVTTVQ